MALYLSINGEAEDLNELSEMLNQGGVENHLGVSKRFTSSTPDIVTQLINTIPYAAIASVLIAWIRMKQNRKVHIQYDDNTSITLEGNYSQKEVEYYFNKKNKAVIHLESER
ncbi:hypothetical protein QWR20_004231 [Vibrio fluvialis]|nr:hypothetical protein [Vibrio fluvialis]